MPRPRHEFKDGEIETITRLWQAGTTADECCRSIGITRNIWEYHRLEGELKHLPKRHHGGYKIGSRSGRKDDPRRQVLFGMKKSEIEKRKAEIRKGWTIEEECFRRTGVRSNPNSRMETYSPGGDLGRSCNPRHENTPARMNRADQNCRRSGLS